MSFPLSLEEIQELWEEVQKEVQSRFTIYQPNY